MFWVVVYNKYLMMLKDYSVFGGFLRELVLFIVILLLCDNKFLRDFIFLNW